MGLTSTAPATPKKSKSSLSSSPGKAKSPKLPPKSPGIQKRRKEWKVSLPSEPWAQQPEFRHPSGTDTVTKTDAKNFPSLNDYDIARLPWELRPRPGRDTLHLYNYDQLRDMARRKCAKLGITLVVGSGSSQTGSVSVISVRNAPPVPEDVQHFLHPSPPPLKIPGYSSPIQAQTADPQKIIWEPSKIMGPVTVDDACRLYCIAPHDIRDLSEHSPWIDLITVAKRAVTLHGGFHAHKTLVPKRRDEEERMLDKAGRFHSNFTFSRIIQLQLEWQAQTADQDMFYAPMGGALSSLKKNHVAVLYPIESVDQGEYGCEWEWMPYRDSI
ncbi:hypothetical protein DFH09DRAFT_1187815 [Mycena vulgaris]|nr:hypothetical protein DFH09DRAFT_1187815 [Mycena vulgaris]